jgi:hypothetical protein
MLKESDFSKFVELLPTILPNDLHRKNEEVIARLRTIRYRENESVSVGAARPASAASQREDSASRVKYGPLAKVSDSGEMLLLEGNREMALVAERYSEEFLEKCEEFQELVFADKDVETQKLFREKDSYESYHNVLKDFLDDLRSYVREVNKIGPAKITNEQKFTVFAISVILTTPRRELWKEAVDEIAKAAAGEAKKAKNQLEALKERLVTANKASGDADSKLLAALEAELKASSSLQAGLKASLSLQEECAVKDAELQRVKGLVQKAEAEFKAASDMKQKCAAYQKTTQETIFPPFVQFLEYVAAEMAKNEMAKKHSSKWNFLTKDNGEQSAGRPALLQLLKGKSGVDGQALPADYSLLHEFAKLHKEMHQLLLEAEKVAIPATPTARILFPADVVLQEVQAEERADGHSSHALDESVHLPLRDVQVEGLTDVRSSSALSKNPYYVPRRPESVLTRPESVRPSSAFGGRQLLPRDVQAEELVNVRSSLVLSQNSPYVLRRPESVRPDSTFGGRRFITPEPTLGTSHEIDAEEDIETPTNRFSTFRDDSNPIYQSSRTKSDDSSQRGMLRSASMRPVPTPPSSTEKHPHAPTTPKVTRPDTPPLSLKSGVFGELDGVGPTSTGGNTNDAEGKRRREIRKMLRSVSMRPVPTPPLSLKSGVFGELDGVGPTSTGGNTNDAEGKRRREIRKMLRSVSMRPVPRPPSSTEEHPHVPTTPKEVGSRMRPFNNALNPTPQGLKSTSDDDRGLDSSSSSSASEERSGVSSPVDRKLEDDLAAPDLATQTPSTSKGAKPSDDDRGLDSSSSSSASEERSGVSSPVNRKLEDDLAAPDLATQTPSTSKGAKPSQGQKSPNDSNATSQDSGSISDDDEELDYHSSGKMAAKLKATVAGAKITAEEGSEEDRENAPIIPIEMDESGNLTATVLTPHADEILQVKQAVEEFFGAKIARLLKEEKPELNIFPGSLLLKHFMLKECAADEELFQRFYRNNKSFAGGKSAPPKPKDEAAIASLPGAVDDEDFIKPQPVAAEEPRDLKLRKSKFWQMLLSAI